uniref:Heat shock 70 kDa protein 12B n=1 Tax=Magallana gigas TaxID=29159 RepID=A0A8W8L6T1_MAGGI|nr:heat shock 70 kDa protein 12A-like [Crassostrea gigas]
MDGRNDAFVSESDVDSSKIDKKYSVCKKQIVASIDIGTAYSGYAYSFRNDWTKVITRLWHGGEYMTHKAPTTLLLEPNGEFAEFGFKAERKYAELAEDEKHQDHYFFRRFKLILKPKLTERVHRETVCIDETGKEFNALKLFTFCIHYLTTSLLEDIYKTIEQSVTMSDIEFVITVPAIWDDTARMFMIEASKATGIQKDQLKIVLESDAASVYCQYMYLEEDKAKTRRDFQDKLIPGFKYMVIDIGGGTTDISVHKKTIDGGLKQVIKPDGIEMGGINVDEAYWKFFCDLFGEDSMKRFKDECTEDYFDFDRKFEVQKRSGKLTTSDDLYIRIPLSLSEVLDDKKGIAEAISSSKYRDIISFDPKSFKLRLPFSEFENLFKDTSDQIKLYLDGLWKKTELADVDTVLLVGGFSECYIIKDMIRNEMKSRKKHLVLPEESSLAVLKGAVYMGHVSDAVSTRISSYSYGMQKRSTFVPEEQLDSKTMVDQKLFRGVFMKLINKGDEIKPEHKEKFYLDIVKTEKDFFECIIYLSHEKDPKYIDEEGVSKIGSLQIKLPNVQKGIVIKIEGEIILLDTEIKVVARELHDLNEFKATFDLLSPDCLYKNKRIKTPSKVLFGESSSQNGLDGQGVNLLAPKEGSFNDCTSPDHPTVAKKRQNPSQNEENESILLQRELIKIQREWLDVEKERLGIERERLHIDRRRLEMEEQARRVPTLYEAKKWPQ